MRIRGGDEIERGGGVGAGGGVDEVDGAGDALLTAVPRTTPPTLRPRTLRFGQRKKVFGLFDDLQSLRGWF